MAPAMSTGRNGPSQDGEGPKGPPPTAWPGLPGSAAASPLGPRPCPALWALAAGCSPPAMDAPPWTALRRSLEPRPAGPAGPGKLDAGPRGPGREKLLAERSAASPQTRLEPVDMKRLGTGPAAGSSRPAHRQVGSMPVLGCCSCQARCQGLVPGSHRLEHILFIYNIDT